MTAAPSGRNIAYFHDEKVSVYASVEAQQLKPHIVRLAHELVKAYGLQAHMQMCGCHTHWQPATAHEVTRFHTDAYVHFLQQLANNAAAYADEAVGFVLNQSVCFTESAWLYSTVYAGASVAAATSLASGASDVAICWMGGQAHARRDCASGYSYVNDVVLATLALLRGPPSNVEERRVMVVNLDAWHCSGVEEAFYTTDRVLTLSVHRYAEGFFPGSGGAADCGEGAGKHHTVNVPVQDGLCDDGLVGIVEPVVAAAAARFCPHAILVCAGAGMVSGDRLGCCNVSLEGQAKCLKALMALDVPLLVLGGGGYTQLNAARSWASATATLCGVELESELPAHAHREYYMPDFQLAVPAATMDDWNDEPSLDERRAAALKTIEAQPQRTKPVAVKAEPPPAAGEAAPPPAAGEEGTAADGAAADSAPTGGAPEGATAGAEPAGAEPAVAPAADADAAAGADADADAAPPSIDGAMEVDEPAAGIGAGAAAEPMEAEETIGDDV